MDWEPKKFTPQMTAVKNYMDEHGSITSLQAFSELGVTRLSGVIFRLKKVGIGVKSEIATTKNRYGGVSNYAIYSLVRSEQ